MCKCDSRDCERNSHRQCCFGLYDWSFWDQRSSSHSWNEKRQRISAHGRFVFIPLSRETYEVIWFPSGMNRSIIVLSSLLLRLMYVLVGSFLCSMNSQHGPKLIFVVWNFLWSPKLIFVNCISCCGYLSFLVLWFICSLHFTQALSLDATCSSSSDRRTRLAPSSLAGRP